MHVCDGALVSICGTSVASCFEREGAVLWVRSPREPGRARLYRWRDRESGPVPYTPSFGAPRVHRFHLGHRHIRTGTQSLHSHQRWRKASGRVGSNSGQSCKLDESICSQGIHWKDGFRAQLGLSHSVASAPTGDRVPTAGFGCRASGADHQESRVGNG